MKLYVETTFVTEVEIDPTVYGDEYADADYETVFRLAVEDPDLHELMPSEPTPFVEARLEVLDNDSADWYRGETPWAAFSTGRLAR